MPYSNIYTYVTNAKEYYLKLDRVFNNSVIQKPIKFRFRSGFKYLVGCGCKQTVLSYAKLQLSTLHEQQKIINEYVKK